MSLGGIERDDTSLPDFGGIIQDDEAAVGGIAAEGAEATGGIAQAEEAAFALTEKGVDNRSTFLKFEAAAKEQGIDPTTLRENILSVLKHPDGEMQLEAFSYEDNEGNKYVEYHVEVEWEVNLKDGTKLTVKDTIIANPPDSHPTDDKKELRIQRRRAAKGVQTYIKFVQEAVSDPGKYKEFKEKGYITVKAGEHNFSWLVTSLFGGQRKSYVQIGDKKIEEGKKTKPEIVKHSTLITKQVVERLRFADTKLGQKRRLPEPQDHILPSGKRMRISEPDENGAVTVETGGKAYYLTSQNPNIQSILNANEEVRAEFFQRAAALAEATPGDMKLEAVLHPEGTFALQTAEDRSIKNLKDKLETITKNPEAAKEMKENPEDLKKEIENLEKIQTLYNDYVAPAGNSVISESEVESLGQE